MSTNLNFYFVCKHHYWNYMTLMLMYFWHNKLNQSNISNKLPNNILEPKSVQPQLHQLFSDHKCPKYSTCWNIWHVAYKSKQVPFSLAIMFQFKVKINNCRNNKALHETPSSHAQLTQHRGNVVWMVWKTPKSAVVPLGPTAVQYSSLLWSLNQLCVQEVICR